MRKKVLLAALMLPISMQVMAQERRITGRVTGDGNQPLPNVSVMIRGASSGTVTNEQGQYSISVPNDRAGYWSSASWALARARKRWAAAPRSTWRCARPRRTT
ncbi:MAG: hypothetical protein EOO11_07920 [Chitinophagaceae bacterium]|nr:MAG: hypothetical protein EOO11_07920 [Chitinophagaceae bacterium]